MPADEPTILATPRPRRSALLWTLLAAEAGVKRWVLTHKHTDLAEEFRNRAAALGPVPVAFSHREQRLHTAEETITRLRAQNRQLNAQVIAYARVIHELRTQADAPGLPQGGLSLVTSNC